MYVENVISPRYVMAWVLSSGCELCSYLHEKHRKVTIILVSLSVMLFWTAVNGQTMPASAYPVDAYLVTIDERHRLQDALDKHGTVRLEPGDYGPGPVTIRSGQQLYGLPGKGLNYTRLGSIVVEPGTEGAIVSGIQGNLKFPDSDAKITKNNAFMRIHGSIIVRGGMLENNLFLDIRGLDADVVSNGYLRNNRFIRLLIQGRGKFNTIRFHANPDRPSTGNVFIRLNANVNHGRVTDILGVPDLTFVGVAAEQWSWGMKEGAPLFMTGEMDELMLFALQGGHYPGQRRGRAITLDDLKTYSIIDSAARNVQVYGMRIFYRGLPPNTLPPRVNLRAGNTSSLFVDALQYSYSVPMTNKLDLRILEDGEFTGKGSKPFAGKELDREQAEILRKKFVSNSDKIIPWEEPDYHPIPIISPGWSRNSSSKPDHTAMLQGRLDSEGIVILPAGKYYISEPLRINRDRGIIGAGMGETVIIAKDPDMSMLVYDPHGKTGGITLANMTLYGGAVGVHMGGLQWEGVHILTNSFISHVTFSGMKEAGILIDSSGGLVSFDNNYVSFCNFVDNAVGIKQEPKQGVSWGFVDKLLMFRSQFVGNDIAIDLPARRRNNSNYFIESLFKNQRSKVARLRNNTTTLFANSDFINNGGDPVISSDRSTYFVNSRFVAGENTRSFLPSYSTVEGSIFKPGESDDVVTIKSPVQNHFINSIVEIPVGALNDGLLANNIFSGNQELSQLAVVVSKGRKRILAEGESLPRPMLLITR